MGFALLSGGAVAAATPGLPMPAGPTTAAPVGTASYDRFLQMLDQGQVESVVMAPDTLTVTLKDGSQVQVARVPDPQLLSRLLAANVTIWGAAAGSAASTASPTWMWWLIGLTVVAGLGGLLWAIGRRDPSGVRTDGMRSPVEVEYRPTDESSIRFSDVAGLARAKRELEDIVAFLRNPEAFRLLGARVPKGVLFEGPPGTGKTLLARALSGEAGAKFFEVAGAAFNEIYVGVGPKRVRQLFAAARKAAPAIIFIDELDAVGSRSTGQPHAEDVRLVTQLLAEMDGFSPLAGVMVVGATNRADALDPALLRPGRFDRIVSLEPPSRDERRAILELHMHGKPFAPDVDPRDWAEATVGMVGADLENMLNEAAIQAVRAGRKQIERGDLVEAYQRTVAGIASDRTLDPEERRRIAYHEAGHAVCGRAFGNQQLQYVSILPRARSGGQTVLLPPEHMLVTREEADARLVMLMGGRSAEIIACGSASSGAAGDLRAATALAHQMVADWGLGSHLTYEPESVGDEVEGVLASAQGRAMAILGERRAQLDALAELLLRHEVVAGEQADACMADAVFVPSAAD